MKHFFFSSVVFALGSLNALAQGANGPSTQASTSSALGWTLVAIGVIAVLVVIARRLSTGQPWKQEIPIALAGILLINFGAWRVVGTKIDDLEKQNVGLQNQVTAAKRSVEEQQAVVEGYRQQIGQWQMRDQEWRKLLGDWQTFAGNLKQQLAAAAAKAAPTPKPKVSPTPSKSTKSKPSPKPTKSATP